MERNRQVDGEMEETEQVEESGNRWRKTKRRMEGKGQVERLMEESRGGEKRREGWRTLNRWRGEWKEEWS